jgi:outer membrane protein assembly factor BamB
MSTAQDIFISYNRKDKSFAEFLVKCLERSGLRCFQDVTGLKIFDKLDASLKLEIAKSKWLVAIISPSYLQSYWCLFEALEAIQGQDLEQRFLPLVLKYTPEDQFLDESFVLKALSDLDGQILEFERQMVQLKAYDLSAKLDKLHFVRANLPKVFRTINDRIFPEFLVWDDAVIRDTLRQLMGRLIPTATIDFDRIPLTFDRLAATPLVIPRLKELPSLLWQTYVGCQAWKNSPVVIGRDVLVGSAGRVWNEPDEQDGIYCLEAQTGALKWFAPTPADANHLLVSKGIVITGCDNGCVVAVSARNGKFLWQTELPHGIVGGPIKLSANIGGSGSAGEAARDPLLVVTHDGGVYLLDLWTGAEMQTVWIGEPVIGDPLLFEQGYEQVIAVPTASGSIFFIKYSNIWTQLGQPEGIRFQYPSEYSETGFETPMLAAQPVFAGNLILQGIVRNTTYPEAPIIAVDSQNRETRWIGTDPDKKIGSFGNLRHTPVIVDQQVLFVSAYSRELCALRLDDGRLLWSVDLSQGMFEQWCGLVATEHIVYAGRHDGYLHRVNTRTRQREWSLFVGQSQHAGVVLSGKQKLPEFDGAYSWGAAGSWPILATPAVDDGRLYVGTKEGYLYCFANLGDS